MPNCSTPEVLYATKEAWKAHILDDHPSSETWSCFACLEAIQFNTEDLFIDHIRLHHQDTISDDQVAALKSVSKVLAPTEIKSCPLCTWPHNNDNCADKRILIDHVAEHVHAFSLRALPWAPDDKIETHAQLQHGVSKTRDWLTKYKLGSPRENFLPLKIGESNSISHYFNTNDYFNEHTEGCSNSDLASDDTMTKELKKMQEEGSLEFSDSSVQSSHFSGSVSGVMVDPEEAFVVARQAVDTTLDDHPDRAAYLNSLGTELENRYQRTGAMALSPHRFHDAAVQQALVDAKSLISRMRDVLGSSILHTDPDSTIRRLHLRAENLATFQCPSTRTVGFVGDTGVGT